jgi:CheY-like chemotaxis protein
MRYIAGGSLVRVTIFDLPSAGRDALRAALEHHGWDVVAFDEVEPALRHVRAALPDVVLADLDAGGDHGAAALARELQLDLSTARVPIVAIRGASEPTPKMRALFEAVLPKPVSIAELPRALLSAIARKRVHR